MRVQNTGANLRLLLLAPAAAILLGCGDAAKAEAQQKLIDQQQKMIDQQQEIIDKQKIKIAELQDRITVLNALQPAINAPGGEMLLKALARAKESAQRANSASNLRQIGMAIEQYAMDFEKGYPEKLSDLYPQQFNTPKVFRSPRSGRPPIITKKQIDTESDYFYISGMKSNMGTDMVIVYEMPIDDVGTNVLFLGDWHVDWWSVAELERHLQNRGLTMKRRQP